MARCSRAFKIALFSLTYVAYDNSWLLTTKCVDNAPLGVAGLVRRRRRRMLLGGA